MRFVARALGAEVQRAARAFAALIVTGPRRAGKTTLLRHVFPDASYHLLEDPDTSPAFVRTRVRSSTRSGCRRSSTRSRTSRRSSTTCARASIAPREGGDSGS